MGRYTFSKDGVPGKPFLLIAMSSTATNRSSVDGSKSCAASIRRPFANSTHNPLRLSALQGAPGAKSATNSIGTIRPAECACPLPFSNGRKRLRYLSSAQ
jgi:hypothetical protein